MLTRKHLNFQTHFTEGYTKKNNLRNPIKKQNEINTGLYLQLFCVFYLEVSSVQTHGNQI